MSYVNIYAVTESVVKERVIAGSSSAFVKGEMDVVRRGLL